MLPWFALVIVLIASAAGAAIDYGRFLTARTSLQMAVDMAALSGASLQDGPESQRISVAQEFASENWRGPSASFTASANASELTVTGTALVETTLLNLVGIGSIPLSVSATADFSGAAVQQTRMCILLLEASDRGLIANSDSKLQANCGIHINSVSHEAMYLNSFGVVDAASICISGRAHLNSGSTASPTPRQGCPSMADPLAGLPVPAAASGACTFSNLAISTSRVLTPGVYCGNTVVNSGATVVLAPGDYVFRDGELLANSGSSIVGNGVMLFFQGQNGRLNVNSNSVLNIAAASAGTYKGIVIFQSPDPVTLSSPPHIVNSDSSTRIEGTIYVPNGQLVLNSFGTANLLSQHLAVIARTMELNSSGRFEVKAAEPGMTGASDVMARWRNVPGTRLLN